MQLKQLLKPVLHQQLLVIMMWKTAEDQTEEVKELEGIRSFELENAKLTAEIEVLKRQRSVKDSRLFQLRNFTTDEDIAFYMGFPNLATFNAVFKFSNTGSKGENIRYRVHQKKELSKRSFTIVETRNQRDVLA